MKPGAITLLTSTLVERGLSFVGKVEGESTVVSTALPVVAVNPRDINHLATKLANRAFEAVKGSKLVFSTPYVEKDRVAIVVGRAKSKAKATEETTEEVAPEAPAKTAEPVEGVDIYAYLPPLEPLA